MPFKVFISYSSRDLTRTAQVKKLLEDAGASVFVAEYSIAAGQELSAAIIRAIRECDVFVLLWSHHAKASEWVSQEVGVAKASNKPIIPVMLHKSALPPGFLRGTKYLPLYKDPKKALDWLHANVSDAARKKKQRETVAWTGLAGVVLWLLNQSER